MRKILMATVVLPLALGQAGVALAQSDADNPRNGNSNQATSELFSMIQQLQSEVRRLQGEVEEQKHLIERLQRQGRDRYIDLDQRILDLSESLASQPAPEPGAGDDASGAEPAAAARDYRQPDAEEREAYDQIQDLIRNQKKYDEAISRIYEFIADYPEGDLTVNAYYWLGEVYLVKPQLQQAKQAFTIVATRYDDHRKAPDALYKLAVSQDRLDESEQARRTLEKVIEDYPSSGAADLARKSLDSRDN